MRPIHFCDHNVHVQHNLNYAGGAQTCKGTGYCCSGNSQFALRSLGGEMEIVSFFFAVVSTSIQ